MAVRIQVSYEGDLQCSAMHEPSQDVLHTDAPKDNQGKGQHFSPTDLLATSLGTCMLTTMGIAAKAHQIDMATAKAQVDKEMGATPRRHVQKVTIKITLAASLDSKARTILEKAATNCPVAASLAPTTEVDVEFIYI